jgi:hypothetical protein
LSPRSTRKTLTAALEISPREATEGATVPLDVPCVHLPHVRRPRRDVDPAVRQLCRQRHRAAASPGHISVPAGVEDGACFHFSDSPGTTSPRASSCACSSAARARLRSVERHVGILAILCTLWGALAMLVGISLLLLSAGRTRDSVRA